MSDRVHVPSQAPQRTAVPAREPAASWLSLVTAAGRSAPSGPAQAPDHAAAQAPDHAATIQRAARAGHQFDREWIETDPAGPEPAPVQRQDDGDVLDDDLLDGDDDLLDGDDVTGSPDVPGTLALGTLAADEDAEPVQTARSAGPALPIQRVNIKKTKKASPKKGPTGKKKVKNPLSAKAPEATFVAKLKAKHRLRRQVSINALMKQPNLTLAAFRHIGIGGQQQIFTAALKRKVVQGSVLAKHFQNIYETSKKQKHQTPQNRTELIGEIAAAMHMMNMGSNVEMLYEFSPGVGIDQIWLDTTNKAYHVIEAKGPGAKTSSGRFAVKGAGAGGGLVQMSPEWVADRLDTLSDKTLRNTILADCGLTIAPQANGTKLLVKSGGGKGYTLEGRVVTASVSDEGDIRPSVSKKRTYP